MVVMGVGHCPRGIGWMDGWMDGWNSMYDGDMRFPGFLFSFFVVDVLMFLISAECFSPLFLVGIRGEVRYMMCAITCSLYE